MQKILLITFFLVLGIGLTYSQKSVLQKEININAKETKLINVLKQISEQTDFFFTYNPKYISEDKKITIQLKNNSVKAVLNKILADTSLNYKIVDDHIIICKKNNLQCYNKPHLTENNNIIEISGQILDAKTNKPITYASVGIDNTTIGTMSNKNGFFNLKIDKNLQDSSLFIASLSYKTLLTPLNNINSYQKTFKLYEDILPIQEVIIRSHDPIKILEKALKNIKRNYYNKTSNLAAFYREGVLKERKIMNFSEAVINIYKAPYKTSFINDKISVLKSRKIINRSNSDTLLVKLKDGLYSNLNLDIIKHPIDFLTNINNYNYQINDIITYGNKLAYVISFTQKEKTKDPLYKGKILIETESFAIIECDFVLNFNASEKKTSFIVNKKRRIKSKTTSAKYKVSYRQINDRYFLSHVRADVKLKIKTKKQLFYKKHHVFSETVVFNIDSLNIKKIDKTKVEKRNKIFIDSHYSYDASFWGESNFIKPEKSIETSLNKIKAKLSYK